MNATLTRAGLRSASDAIRKLLQGSESEFLGIVNELADLTGQAQHIASDAADALRAAGEAASEDVGERIREDVAIIREVIEAGRTAARDGGKRLHALDEALTSLDLLGGEFRRLVLTLRSLASLTRMEGSRTGLEGSGFLAVSDDVSALANLIQDRFEALHHRAAPLRSLVFAASSNRRELGAGVVEMLDGVLTSTSHLLDVNREAQARMVRVNESMSSVSAAFGQVIVNLQFHDMTRQQLEHVLEAMAEVDQDLAKHGDDRAALGRAGDVTELLVGQVANARTEIRRAVGDLVANLSASGERVRAVEHELSGASRGSIGVLRDLEEQLGEALAALHAGHARTADLVEVAGSITTIVAELSNFISEIGGIGDQIHLIAFNAIVRSARTGDAGRAIGVLADEIQSVASETQRYTGSAKSVLATIKAEAKALHETARALGAGEARRADEIAADLKALLERIGTADTAMYQGFTQAADAGRRLQAQVDRLGRNISYHVTAGHTLSQVGDRLRAIADDMTRGGHRDASARAAHLAQHLSRYTMDSERRVHAAAARAQAAGPAPARPHASDPGLGANVELF